VTSILITNVDSLRDTLAGGRGRRAAIRRETIMERRRIQPLTAMMVVAVGFGIGGWGLGRHATVKADAGFTATPAMQSAVQMQQAFGQAIDRVMPATVSIETKDAEGEASGSGFIVTPGGCILTNDHVVHGARQIQVYLPDRDTPYEGKLVGTDEASDVAVVQIKADAPLPVAPMGNSDEVGVGQWAIAIGNPMDLGQTVTIGVVSATGRVTGVTRNKSQDYIQTDAAINPGNSGGPLVNVLGQVIGINNHILSNTGQSTGIGFAVPINTARAVAGQLILTGHFVRGRLGVDVAPLDTTQIAALGVSVSGHPVRVTSVFAGGPAATAGMQVGDVVLTLDGKPLRGLDDFRNREQLTPVGQPLPLIILRGGQQYTVQAKTEPMPDPLGVKVATVTRRMALKYGLRASTGVVIVVVEEGGAAEKLNLQPGMVISAVNGQPVTDAESLAQAWAETAGGRTVTLTIDGRNYTLQR
jgi:S1-C subfamily serine protease